MNGMLPERARDVMLFVARMVLGVVLFAHGWDKLVLTGIAETRNQFDALGIPLAIASASFVTFVEFAGGILFVLGALMPVVALLHLVVMVGATAFVHLSNGIYAADNGWELVGVIGAAELLLAVAGAGRYSFDGLSLHRIRFAWDGHKSGEPEEPVVDGSAEAEPSTVPEPEAEPDTTVFPVQNALPPPADTPMFGEPVTSSRPGEGSGAPPLQRRIPRPVAPLQGRSAARRSEQRIGDPAEPADR